MALEEVEAVVRTWTEQTVELGSKDFIQYVQVFENRGAMMGASNPHPHSQIWTTGHIPNEPAAELEQQAEYMREARHLPVVRLYRCRTEQRRADGRQKRALQRTGSFLGDLAV